ncbi:hypothetical protein MMC18_003632 [Xylographa bjoerkii]|nr:hypothetical protein [Xylographa bjoerkii]
MASHEPLRSIEFPDDILLEIFRTCLFHPAILVNLCQVSKRFQTLCTPFLYKCVDISFHDEVKLINHSGYFFQREYDPNPSRPRQHAFLHTLKSRPEYGPLVRSLKWTLDWSIIDVCVDTCYEYKLPDIEYSTWDVFSSLTNIQNLDLGCVNDVFAPFMHENPPMLFPAARRVRFFGNMHLGLVSSILHTGDPVRFESLSIDDLQDVGQYPNGIPIYPDDHGIELDRIRESTNPDGTRGLVFPGPMRGVLGPLLGRCTALKSLVLNKFGLECNNYRGDDLPEKLDTSVYVEYSDFLDSVKSQLEVFRFEQGVPAQPTKGRTRDYTPGGVYQAIRPMDQDFLTFILPIILAGGWSKLRKMEIRGIGRWKDRPALSECMKIQIREALGPNVTCIIEEEARPMWPCRGMYAGLTRQDLKKFEISNLID